MSFRIRDRRVPIGEIRDVELEHYRRRSSSRESHGVIYRLNLIMESGMEYRLVNGQTKKATYFIQKTLKAMLAARSERFPEEWKV